MHAEPALLFASIVLVVNAVFILLFCLIASQQKKLADVNVACLLIAYSALNFAYVLTHG